ncbi:hypothetical protein I3843_01G101900 [Carya illinoinensis]|nr:hypothetical protein I3843_01G101900 [Carya illinoinensis]
MQQNKHMCSLGQQQSKALTRTCFDSQTPYNNHSLGTALTQCTCSRTNTMHGTNLHMDSNLNVQPQQASDSHAINYTSSHHKSSRTPFGQHSHASTRCTAAERNLQKNTCRKIDVENVDLENSHMHQHAVQQQKETCRKTHAEKQMQKTWT